MNKRTDLETVLTAALSVAEVKGYTRMTRECIAVAAAVSPALVSLRLGTMVELRRAVMRAAVKRRNIAVVAQGLAAGDPHAQRADASLKAEVAAFVCR